MYTHYYKQLHISHCILYFAFNPDFLYIRKEAPKDLLPITIYARYSITARIAAISPRRKASASAPRSKPPVITRSIPSRKVSASV